VVAVGEQLLPPGHVPQLDGTVSSRRGQRVARGGESESVNRPVMPAGGRALPARGRLPEPHHPVLPTARDGPRVRGAGHRTTRPPRAAWRGARLPRGGVPEPPRPVLARRRQGPAVRGEGQAIHRAPLTVQRPRLAAVRQVVEVAPGEIAPLVRLAGPGPVPG